MIIFFLYFYLHYIQLVVMFEISRVPYDTFISYVDVQLFNYCRWSCACIFKEFNKGSVDSQAWVLYLSSFYEQMKTMERPGYEEEL